jgi:pilus assembly protein CpaB
MNRTLIFAGLGALATALLVAMLISASIGGKKSNATEVLVATKDMSIGSAIDANNTRWQKWPNASAIPGVIIRDKVKEDDWKEQKIRRALVKGEPITEGALVREIKGSYLAAALEPGMRAVSIDVKAASGVAGFLSPGDRVDVILTYHTRMDTNNAQIGAALLAGEDGMLERASETIVQNARVMAADQDAAGNQAGGERKAKVNKTVTIEVTPKEAEMLVIGTEMGELHFSLRQLGDVTKIDPTASPTTDVTTAKVLREQLKDIGRFDNPNNSQVRVYTPNEVNVIKVIPSDLLGSKDGSKESKAGDIQQ